MIGMPAARSAWNDSRSMSTSVSQDGSWHSQIMGTRDMKRSVSARTPIRSFAVRTRSRRSGWVKAVRPRSRLPSDSRANRAELDS